VNIICHTPVYPGYPDTNDFHTVTLDHPVKPGDDGCVYGQ